MSGTTRIGFIGLGAMGAPMAKNLSAAGHKIVAYDSDAGRAALVAEQTGGEAAADLAALAATCTVVITMLPTGRDVRSVLLEADGGALASGLSDGALVIDMSSSDPVGTRDLGLVLKDRGITLIDAPVSGGVPGAVNATLAIMVGGEDEAAIDRAWPLFQAMGKNLFRTGPSGSGHAMKALNNFVGATSYASAAEALLIGSKFGLDPATMIDILNVSTGRTYHTEVHYPRQVLPRAFAAGFKLGLMSKDVRTAGDLGAAMGVEAPVSRLIADLWTKACDDLGPDADFTSAIRDWEALNGFELPSAKKDKA